MGWLEWRTALYVALELISGLSVLGVALLVGGRDGSFGPGEPGIWFVAGTWLVLGACTAARRRLRDAEALVSMLAVIGLLTAQGVLVKDPGWQWMCAATLVVLPVAAVMHFRHRLLLVVTVAAGAGQALTVVSVGGPPGRVLYTAATFVMITSVPVVVVAVLTGQLQAARRDAEVVARTDSLTGLLNRHGLHVSSLPVLERAVSTGGDLGVMAVDIDHFKAVNDTFGHSAGDRVLAVVGHALRTAAREHDVVVRQGGEEFVVLAVLPGTEDVAPLAERLRVAVAEAEAADAPRVTASVGTARMAAGELLTASGGDQDDGPTCAAVARDVVARLIDEADEALYAAKRAGRNRVHHG